MTNRTDNDTAVDTLLSSLSSPQLRTDYQVETSTLLISAVSSDLRPYSDSIPLLQTRLFLLVRAMERVREPLIKKYETAVGVTVAAYFRIINSQESELLPAWKSVCEVVNHFSARRKTHASLSQKLLNTAIKHGLIASICAITQWISAPLLGELDLVSLKSDIATAGLTANLYENLLKRVSSTPEDCVLLKCAIELAENDTERATVGRLSLLHIHQFFKYPLTNLQRSLLSDVVYLCGDSILTEDFPYSLMFSYKDIIPGAKSIVRKQVLQRIHTFRYFQFALCGAAVASCFTYNLRDLLEAKMWDVLSDLRVEVDLDQFLCDNLHELLKAAAPEWMLIFTSLPTAARCIRIAEIAYTSRQRVLERCLQSRSWSDYDLYEASSDIAAIRRLAKVAEFLFVKSRSKFERLPSLLARDIAVEYL